MKAMSKDVMVKDCHCIHFLDVSKQYLAAWDSEKLLRNQVTTSNRMSLRAKKSFDGASRSFRCQ